MILKRNSRQDSEGMFVQTSHDLNKLLNELRTGSVLHLPKEIYLDELTLSKLPKIRKAKCGELNQVWRYGAQARNPTDTELEAKLSAINEWIREELK